MNGFLLIWLLWKLCTISSIGTAHAPVYENRFGFQRMNDKAKDGLVLSVVWRWSSLRLCFFLGRTIKEGMN
jgi:hypothetical protein